MTRPRSSPPRKGPGAAGVLPSDPAWFERWRQRQHRRVPTPRTLRQLRQRRRMNQCEPWPRLRCSSATRPRVRQPSNFIRRSTTQGGTRCPLNLRNFKPIFFSRSSRCGVGRRRGSRKSTCLLQLRLGQRLDCLNRTLQSSWVCRLALSKTGSKDAANQLGQPKPFCGLQPRTPRSCSACHVDAFSFPIEGPCGLDEGVSNSRGGIPFHPNRVARAVVNMNMHAQGGDWGHLGRQFRDQHLAQTPALHQHRRQ